MMVLVPSAAGILTVVVAALPVRSGSEGLSIPLLIRVALLAAVIGVATVILYL